MRLPGEQFKFQSSLLAMVVKSAMIRNALTAIGGSTSKVELVYPPGDDHYWLSCLTFEGSGHPIEENKMVVELGVCTSHFQNTIDPLGGMKMVTLHC